MNLVTHFCEGAFLARALILLQSPSDLIKLSVDVVLYAGQTAAAAPRLLPLASKFVNFCNINKMSTS